MANKNEKITVLTREEMFAKECKVFDLRQEYPGFDGEVYWAIATSYSKAELYAFYAEFIMPCEPFMLLSAEEGEAMTEYNKNQHKHDVRQTRNGIVFEFSDGETEMYHPELVNDDLLEEVVRHEENRQLWSAINELKEPQKRRIIKKYFGGKSERQIAIEEDVGYAAVFQSVAAGIKNIKKFLEETTQMTSPSAFK